MTDKQKNKKGREIQTNQIFIVSITISNIFCALELEVKVKSYRCPKFGGMQNFGDSSGAKEGELGEVSFRMLSGLVG